MCARILCWVAERKRKAKSVSSACSFKLFADNFWVVVLGKPGASVKSTPAVWELVQFLKETRLDRSTD